MLLLRPKNVLKYLSDPLKIVNYIRRKIMKQILSLRTKHDINTKNRVTFDHKRVAGNWGFKGAGLPHYSSRIFKEVHLFHEAIEDLQAHRSLEIGCGYGRLTPWIAEHSEEHYAVEPEKELFENATMLNPQIKIFNVSAQKLPFPDDYFDLCISWTVLQHIPSGELLQEAINEIKRVCNEHSVIIIAEGIGSNQSPRYWERSIDEYSELFSPWRLSWQKERQLEETFTGNGGLILKFTRSEKT